MTLKETLAKYDRPEHKRELPHQCERCGMLCKSLRGLKIHLARTAFCNGQEEPDAKADATE